jgi:hypothetical protein
VSEPRDGALFADKLELLARLLAAEDLGGAVERIERRPAAEPPVLSFAQQRMWFLDQWAPESAAYLICEALSLAGEPAVAALRASFAEVVRRH